MCIRDRRIAVELIVERSVAACTGFQRIEEIVNNLRQRQLIMDIYTLSLHDALPISRGREVTEPYQTKNAG